MQSAWRDVVELLKQYREVRTEYWLNENLFTFSWWILLVTTAGIFIVWLIILDKKEYLRLSHTVFLLPLWE